MTGFGGYFVANISTSDASNLSVGRSIKLQLDAMGDELVDMTVESISIQENGLVTVVFSYNRHMEELINMRKQSAMVVLEQYEGLKVPREAARVDADGWKQRVEWGLKAKDYVVLGSYDDTCDAIFWGVADVSKSQTACHKNSKTVDKPSIYYDIVKEALTGGK